MDEKAAISKCKATRHYLYVSSASDGRFNTDKSKVQKHTKAMLKYLKTAKILEVIVVREVPIDE